MNFDKSQLEALAALPDDKLWAEVVRIAASFGYTLPEATPSHADLEKMRSAVRSDKINVQDALRVVNRYRRGK
nr:hypothetical protein [Oscillospiraceae bacterium]